MAIVVALHVHRVVHGVVTDQSVRNSLGSQFAIEFNLSMYAATLHFTALNLGISAFT